MQRYSVVGAVAIIAGSLSAYFITKALRTPRTYTADITCHFDPRAETSNSLTGASVHDQIKNCNQLLRDIYDKVGDDNSNIKFRMAPLEYPVASPAVE